MKNRPYKALRKRIVAKYGTMHKFAEAIGLSATTVSNKLNNKTPWRVDDITLCCSLLEIKKEDVSFYFF